MILSFEQHCLSFFSIRVVFYAIVSLIGLLVGCSETPVATGSDADPSRPAEYEISSQTLDEEVTHFSQYVQMTDGVNIAIDVYVPDGGVVRKTYPTILHQTRYWRSLEYRWPLSWFKDGTPREMGIMGELTSRFLAQGYVWVNMDVRGSGASFGYRRYAYAPEEIRDGADIVDWIIRQPWSNGKVGAIGVSYGGTAAEFLLVTKHPAVKAVAPMFSSFDVYTDFAFPGGLHLSRITQSWEEIISRLDQNMFLERSWLAGLFIKGVRPVDGDHNHSLLELAIREHSMNWNPHQVASEIMFRDDEPPSQDLISIDTLSPHTYVEETNRSGAAVYGYSGWFDGAYSSAAIKRHLRLTNPANKLILGPWDHGGNRNISPSSYGESRFDHAGELLQFFDYHLKGIDAGITSEKRIRYFTMIEDQWKTVDLWPPKATLTSYYFASEYQLKIDRPVAGNASDSYKVDATAGTGAQSRWHTLLGFPITHPYPDRTEQDEKLLCYTSKPLTQDTEVTGHPVVTLHVSSTSKDGAYFVYLEDVDESGQVRYVTEGMLRAIHQRLGTRPSSYGKLGPYRTFRRAEAQPLVPGEIATLTFDLFPTSYLFKKGHRIRVGLAGADTDHFVLLQEKPPTVDFYRSAQYPSRIDLPVAH